MKKTDFVFLKIWYKLKYHDNTIIDDNHISKKLEFSYEIFVSSYIFK